VVHPAWEGRQDVQWHVVWHPDGIARRGQREAGKRGLLEERAVDGVLAPAEAERGAIRTITALLEPGGIAAVGLKARATLRTGAARRIRHDDMVPGLQRRDGRAHLLDHAGTFMSVHGRTRHGKKPIARVHIGLANATGHHAHQDLLWSWLGDLHRFECPASMPFGHHGGSGLHRLSPAPDGLHDGRVSTQHGQILACPGTHRATDSTARCQRHSEAAAHLTAACCGGKLAPQSRRMSEAAVRLSARCSVTRSTP